MKIVINGYYGVKNLGDDYILYALLESFKKKDFHSLEITILADGSHFEEFYKLFPKIKFNIIYLNEKKIFMNDLKKIKCRIFAFLKADMYLLGGGGLFPNDSFISYLKVLADIILCKFIGVKVIQVYGIDLCDIRKKISRWIWRQICKRAVYINFRNKFSYDLVHEFYPSEKVTYFPDITFSLTTDIERKNFSLENIIAEKNIKENNYIIWALANPWSDREMKDAYIGHRYKKLCLHISSICNYCTELGYINVFLPFFHLSDCNLINDIVPCLKSSYYVCDENTLQLSQKRALFKYAKACVSMRFHGVAFSLYHGIPVAAIAYAPKTSKLLEEYGLSEYCTKFGIRKTSGFFEEFDLDMRELNRIIDLVVKVNDKELFERISLRLKKEAAINEKRMLSYL